MTSRSRQERNWQFSFRLSQMDIIVALDQNSHSSFLLSQMVINVALKMAMSSHLPQPKHTLCSTSLRKIIGGGGGGSFFFTNTGKPKGQLSPQLSRLKASLRRDSEVEVGTEDKCINTKNYWK